MSTGPRTIRSICVAGAGITGLSAALAFARALPGTSVTILDIAADPAALTNPSGKSNPRSVRQPASLPTVHRFHRAIGLDELELVRAGAATHLLATRFDHWAASDQPWYHSFGEHGRPAGDVPFHEHASPIASTTATRSVSVPFR